MYLLSVDPGKHFCGWGFFRDGRLFRCGYTPSDTPLFLGPIDRIVMELPQVYPGTREEDPNDLIDVAFNGAIFCARVFYMCKDIKTYKPRKWKGTVPKDIMVDRIKDLLKPEEKIILAQCEVPEKKEHNVVDGIGIGLRELGRL